MKLLGLLGVVFCLLVLPTDCRATVDGGTTASLLGTAQGTRLAVIIEKSVQEECEYVACVVYVIDTTQRDFLRRHLVKLPARFDELSSTLCSGDKSPECARKVHQRLAQSDSDQDEIRTDLLGRYKRALSVWQRAALGPIAPPPAPIEVKSSRSGAPANPLVLSGIGPAAFSLSIKERWTVPSFRAYTENDTYCYPERISTCHREERWEDGVRADYWVCEKSEGSADCSGRASMVRVQAEWGSHGVALGRSSLVQPGGLAQAAVGLVSSRTVDVSTLEMTDYTQRLYRLDHAILAVGGFAHGIGANGSWFPLVVAVPTVPPTESSP